jgi:hypothetical protein
MDRLVQQPARAVADAFEAAVTVAAVVSDLAGRPRGEASHTGYRAPTAGLDHPGGACADPFETGESPATGVSRGATGSRLKALCANIRSGQCGGHGSANRGEDRATRCNTRQ